ncbi:sel1 repeat family protein [bacterium]|nr:sel1 repeat family protein [bacterium]
MKLIFIFFVLSTVHISHSSNLEEFFKIFHVKQRSNDMCKLIKEMSTEQFKVHFSKIDKTISEKQKQALLQRISGIYKDSINPNIIYEYVEKTLLDSFKSQQSRILDDLKEEKLFKKYTKSLGRVFHASEEEYARLGILVHTKYSNDRIQAIAKVIQNSQQVEYAIEQQIQLQDSMLRMMSLQIGIDYSKLKEQVQANQEATLEQTRQTIIGVSLLTRAYIFQDFSLEEINSFDELSYGTLYHLEYLIQMSLSTALNIATLNYVDKVSTFINNLKDYSSNSIEELQKLAQSGDAKSQYILALHYKMGDGGVKSDHQKFVRWMTSSAEQEYAEACDSLGLYYSENSHQQQNCKKSVKWLEKGLEQGYEGSINNLAYVLSFEKNQCQDVKRAYTLMKDYIIDHRSPANLDTYATILYEMKQFDEAISTQEEALQIIESYGYSEESRKIFKEHLQKFRKR